MPGAGLRVEDNYFGGRLLPQQPALKSFSIYLSVRTKDLIAQEYSSVVLWRVALASTTPSNRWVMNVKSALTNTCSRRQVLPATNSTSNTSTEAAARKSERKIRGLDDFFLKRTGEYLVDGSRLLSPLLGLSGGSASALKTTGQATLLSCEIDRSSETIHFMHSGGVMYMGHPLWSLMSRTVMLYITSRLTWTRWASNLTVYNDLVRLSCQHLPKPTYLQDPIGCAGF